MNIISDTNIILAVALDEPEKDHIIRLTAGTNAVAPEILPYEIGNALSAMTKQKLLTPDEAFQALAITESIPIRLISVDVHEALKIAAEFQIYAYDAYFLQCARFLSCPILTLDRRMKQVAAELDIDVLE
jgi:predicted nucleic acid-binding protein